MTSLQVLPVTSRPERRQFLNLPHQLYRDDPRWVPAIRGEEEQLLGFRSHPFHQRNEVQAFVALRGQEVVGRIAAIHNREHNQHHQDRLGFFGFFECRDDLQAARALTATAGGWARARGLEAMRGPMSPSINYQAGVLVEGFDTDPSFLTPYNKPYYGELLERCGFQKSQDLYALRSTAEDLPNVLARGDRVVGRLTQRYGITVRRLSRKQIQQDLAEFLGVINQSLKGHWGFIPLSRAELAHVVRGLRWLLVPELVVGLEVEGRLAAVALALPDYNPRVRQIGGRLFPFGFMRLLAHKQGIKRLRVVAANVLPEFNRKGLGVALIHNLLPEAMKWGCREMEFSWIAESNTASHGTLDNAGAQRIRTYRVYDRGE